MTRELPGEQFRGNLSFFWVEGGGERAFFENDKYVPDDIMIQGWLNIKTH